MSSSMLRCLKVLGTWIVAAGGMWVPPPPVPIPPTGPLPAGPPPGHPERLGPGDPLTELELMLRRELPGWP
ncbi:DUF6059 family protein [Streptomyces sp. NPDC002044]|uniref:DUF6059 family protein n=1 Tax=Streptomyces sp. NPDC002044 TaxID=3154662 RepID=UPI003323C084